MEKITELIKTAVSELFDAEVEPNVTLAPENVSADYASNVAMQLAKTLHQNPMEIAQKIADKLEGVNVEIVAPGFLNFISPDEYFVAKITDFNQNLAKSIAHNEYLDKKVIVEFSDPNPFKVLHVGHLYTSIVGDSMARIFEFAGAKAIRANFGGDVGLHVAKTMYMMLKRQDEMKDLEDAEKQAEFMASCYVEGTRKYEEDETAHEKIVALNKEIYQISLEDKHDSDVAKIYWQGREWSYDYFKKFYAKVGVSFDKYYPESSVTKRALEEVQKGLEAGVYEKSDGAVVYRGEKHGLHTRVFINQNGLPTYEAKDVGLIFTKWDDYHFDKSVVITGNDVIDYMKVVLASIAELNPTLAERTLHLTHGNVRLPGNEKMSSRKGNFLRATDVINMISESLSKEHEMVDFKVVLAAAKYAFLKYKIGGDIIFDPKESVSLTGNSGVYILYSAVRAKKILAKDFTGSKNENWKMNEAERDLSKKIIQYGVVLKEAIDSVAPYKICNFLYELAQEFSRFYEHVKVAGSEFEFERRNIVSAYLKVMEHGLALLGIEVPEEM